MYEGTISKLVLDRGFGFIAVPNQPDVFFHVKDLGRDLPFDETLQERRVRFDIADGHKGPHAVMVRAAE